MNLSGDFFDFVKAFLGGVILSFTPCLYPLFPITVGFIGAGAAGSRLRGLTLSFIYVSGLAITYSLLGLIASLTGAIFGYIGSHPVTYLVVGSVVILFGISMFDILRIPLPQGIQLRTPKNVNYISTFFLGATSGLVVSPCVSPVLGAILAYLATKKNILYGMALLLSFAYGMGFLLIIIGTFSSILVGLPKPGKWMVYVKKASGALLIAMGLYFLYIAKERWGW